MNRWTQLVQYDPCKNDPYRANSTPLYQTATFSQESIDCHGEYDYTRSGNPTRTVVEEQIAKLENGRQAFAFNSGMAAISTVMGLLQQGDHIIVGDDLYGGTHRLLSQRLPQRGITFSLVDTTDLQAIEDAFKQNTRLVFIETPSNPLQKITDIAAVADLAHQHNTWLAVDNTFLSPWLQQPLMLGADLVIHSATKHLAGHSDTTAGVIVVNSPELAKSISFIQNAEGVALAPFECWLLLRGLKTLGLRIEREQAVAAKVVSYLAQQSIVKKLYYPGLIEHPGFAIHKKQAKGFGSVISFETGSLPLSRQLINETKLFSISVSFGSLNSLISLPCHMSHASKPEKDRSISPDLIRLSIGIEDPDDLIADLDQAVKQVCANNKHKYASVY